MSDACPTTTVAPTAAPTRAPTPAPTPAAGDAYCYTPTGYRENGRTNFGNDVCNGCTLADCKARCDSIAACVGFDTSISGSGSGTCWMKSYISIAAADWRSNHGGTRTTYFNEDRNSDASVGCQP